jgi:hypothetical protein
VEITASKITLTKAFADYGATLRNVRWAVSAIAKDGSLVFSCWDQFLTQQPGGRFYYTDNLSRWHRNFTGRDLLREHLTQAFSHKLRVRLVVATLKDPKFVTADAQYTIQDFFCP